MKKRFSKKVAGAIIAALVMSQVFAGAAFAEETSGETNITESTESTDNSETTSEGESTGKSETTSEGESTGKSETTSEGESTGKSETTSEDENTGKSETTSEGNGSEKLLVKAKKDGTLVADDGVEVVLLNALSDEVSEDESLEETTSEEEEKAANDYTKWKADLVKLGETTEGVTVTLDDSTGIDTIIYTITADVNGDININVVDDIVKVIGGTYVPGQS